MMKKILSISLSALFLPVLLLTGSGCALFDKDKSLLPPVMWGTIDRNRENLAKLRVGMTTEEVLKIMGEPLKKETYNTSTHWFYYTRTRWCDWTITRDECTPLVFDESGTLEGWGELYFQKYCNYTFWTEKAVQESLK